MVRLMRGVYVRADAVIAVRAVSGYGQKPRVVVDYRMGDGYLSASSIVVAVGSDDEMFELAEQIVHDVESLLDIGSGVK